MDEMKLQYLINMSRRYFDSKLENNEKKSVEDAAQILFYQSLYEDLPNSELNKKIRMFAAMALNMIKDKPISHQKEEDLQKMAEYMQRSIIRPVQCRNRGLSLL